MSLPNFRIPSHTSHTFSNVPSADIQRSRFDRSHGYKTTFNADYLIPILVDEVLPGDTFDLKCTAFARLATPLFPFMDNMFADTFFFYVPTRLLWTHWEQFNGQQANPADSISYVVPQLVAPASVGAAVGDMWDYFGLPTGIASLSVNSLPFRAYNFIWNEWFRDENLQNSVTFETDDGPDTYTNYVVLQRGKRKDYFTSALPWTQKGGVNVTIPLSGTAPVTGIGVNGSPSATAQTLLWETNATSTVNYSGAWNPGNMFIKSQTTGAPGSSNTPQVFANLAAATGATINQLRQSFQIQKLLERDARGGTRYTEILRSHFGVVSPDSRLQRPEYLGGSSTPININPIAQTSGTSASGTTTPLGNLAGVGSFVSRNNGFTKSFVEHGYIIGLLQVRADLTYQNGINRMWSRSTRYDFYWPALSHIGEQAVLNQEIYAQGTSADTQVFGYQERYAEYRYFPSLITGQFRSSYSTPLDMWHLAQKFTSLPTLNAAFIVSNTPVARVVAVPSQPQFLLDCLFQTRVARPMPLYGVPGLIDHF